MPEEINLSELRLKSINKQLENLDLRLQSLENDLKSASEQSATSTPPQNPDLISKKVAAVEVLKELKLDKVINISTVVGSLMIFGFTMWSTMLGGLCAVSLIGLVAWRLVMAVKRMEYLKKTYAIN